MSLSKVKYPVLITNVTKFIYTIGEIDFSVDIQLTEEQKSKINEIIQEKFGENARAKYIPEGATITVEIVDKDRYNQYIQKLYDETKAKINEPIKLLV